MCTNWLEFLIASFTNIWIVWLIWAIRWFFCRSCPLFGSHNSKGALIIEQPWFKYLEHPSCFFLDESGPKCVRTKLSWGQNELGPKWVRAKMSWDQNKSGPKMSLGQNEFRPKWVGVKIQASLSFEASLKVHLRRNFQAKYFFTKIFSPVLELMKTKVFKSREK